MKVYTIESGHFSKAGNFVAYSTKGERIHIYKKQIFEEFPMAEIVHRCLGVYENAQVKFPFYCLADVQTFNSTDGTTFDRLTAIKISKDDNTIKYYSLETRHIQLVIENASLKQSLCDLDYKCDALKAENIDLEDRLKEMTWNYEYAQSERERLQLLCDELKKDKLSKRQLSKLKLAQASVGMTKQILDKLIN